MMGGSGMAGGSSTALNSPTLPPVMNAAPHTSSNLPAPAPPSPIMTPNLSGGTMATQYAPKAASFRFKRASEDMDAEDLNAGPNLKEIGLTAAGGLAGGLGAAHLSDLAHLFENRPRGKPLDPSMQPYYDARSRDYRNALLKTLAGTAVGAGLGYAASNIHDKLGSLYLRMRGESPGQIEKAATSKLPENVEFDERPGFLKIRTPAGHTATIPYSRSTLEHHRDRLGDEGYKAYLADSANELSGEVDKRIAGFHDSFLNKNPAIRKALAGGSLGLFSGIALGSLGKRTGENPLRNALVGTGVGALAAQLLPGGVRQGPEHVRVLLPSGAIRLQNKETGEPMQYL
jgi:hypothetical protein